MPIEVTMPKLSDTMEEGKILRWLKKPGEAVAVGDVLAEVETDKADMELEAFAEGVLQRIVVQEGESVSVGDLIAVLAEAGEEAPGRSGDAERPENEKAREARPAERAGDGRAGIDEAAPAARRMAEGQAIDRSRVTGSGPAGRVVKRDLAARRPAEKTSAVAEARAEPAAPPAGPPAATAAPAERRGARREELATIRRTVARRMTESKREAPHFYMTAEIEMRECARLKEGLAAARPDGPAVSYTHLVLRAVAVALGRHPRINARYVKEDAIEHPEGIHLGIAVAAEQGLIVPVVHDCQAKDVFEIAAEARAVVERVRGGKAHGDDLTGGTFTVSNLGMFPVEEFAAVINPPQAAVLAIGAVRERALVRAGRIVAEPTMRVTLSSDHRVIDGIEAARFLETLKHLLENPVQLLLG